MRMTLYHYYGVLQVYCKKNVQVRFNLLQYGAFVPQQNGLVLQYRNILEQSLRKQSLHTVPSGTVSFRPVAESVNDNTLLYSSLSYFMNSEKKEAFRQNRAI